MAPALTVDGLTKAFGDTHALAGASLEADYGEVHAVVGENGSGKSTLVKILSGVYRQDRGEVRVDGSPVRHASPARLSALGVEAVFQEVLVVDSASVCDNVFLGQDGLFRSSRTRAARRAECVALLERLTGQRIDPDAPAETLPLSLKQWLTIARALARSPRILILDESSAALDLEDARRLAAAVEELRVAGSCILLVTHRILELESLAQRATVLRNGVTVATVERDEISERRLLQLMTGHQEAGLERARREHPGDGAPRTVLEAREIRLSPGGAPFSFTVAAGEIVGLAGLDGHGQRETIQALAGVRAPRAGTVARVADGVRRPYSDIREAAANDIAYVSGDRKRDGILAQLSILENFGVSTYAKDTTAGVIRRRATRRRLGRFIDSLSIRLRSTGDPITTLSGGNQQKVLLARALALKPAVLLLDDASRGVDIETKYDMQDILAELAHEGVAVVVLSTELEELDRICDRTLVFRHGFLAAELRGGRTGVDEMLAAMFGVMDPAEAVFDRIEVPV